MLKGLDGAAGSFCRRFAPPTRRGPAIGSSRRPPQVTGQRAVFAQSGDPTGRGRCYWTPSAKSLGRDETFTSISGQTIRRPAPVA